jgi:phosphonate metabolism protein (transferase hexapeptide repeat family)
MAEFPLNGEPVIDPTAEVKKSALGKWTAVGARALVTETIIGDYSYVMNDCDLIYTEIGKFCSIASHTRINPGNHPLCRATLHHFTYRSRPYHLGTEDENDFFNWRRSHKVIIEHDVWIGHGAILLPGVRIGVGAAIGAGAVVTKDVPPFTIVTGVPAKVLRRRLSPEVEAALMRVRWWEWPHERISESLEDFRKLDAAAFAAKYDPSKKETTHAGAGKGISGSI